MADLPLVICQSCGARLQVYGTEPRTIRNGLVVACGQCPPERLSELTRNDKRLLKALRIAAD